MLMRPRFTRLRRSLSIRRAVQALAPKSPEFTEELLALSGDGHLRWQEWTNRGIFDADGRLTEIQSSGRDITDRKRTEEA